MSSSPGTVTSGAHLVGSYRLRLWRIWGPGQTVLFVMLNPSTADEEKDDPTIRRCLGFAKAWGYGGLEVVNLFALRATSPKELYSHPEPVGAGNDEAITLAARRAELVIAAWGSHGSLDGRGKAVAALLRVIRPLHCLKLNSDGQPSHPLYLHRSLRPLRWEAP